MPRRTMVIFWGAVGASSLLLGAAVGTIRRLASGGNVLDGSTLLLSTVGLAAALIVAGRIVVIAARLQRRARRP